MESEFSNLRIDYKLSALSLSLYSPDEITLTVNIDGDGILVITNQFNKFWKCKINGKVTPVFPAYGTFQGVQLEKGKNLVYLYYDPPWRILPFPNGNNNDG